MFRISAKVGGMGEGDDRVYHERATEPAKASS
jgi:hypothetical protein